MSALYWTIRNFVECPREKGQTMAEYALILVLIAVVVIAGLTFLGPVINGVFGNIGTQLSPATGGG